MKQCFKYKYIYIYIPFDSIINNINQYFKNWIFFFYYIVAIYQILFS